jgi:hypothetical protein
MFFKTNFLACLQIFMERLCEKLNENAHAAHAYVQADKLENGPAYLFAFRD